jgi:hypothetical protein
VTFDPDIPEQLASYSHDDDGTPAHKAFLIREGLLLRPLGGALSQFRSGLGAWPTAAHAAGTAHPIDRMANLNIEPGDQSLAQLIGGIEHGILMATNRSWSIDDARNKFQFGCEWGQLIENGELKGVVKNPNYRAHFRAVLAQASAPWATQHLQSAGHAQLRQRRTQPGDPRRACFAGVCIQRYRCVWRGCLMDQSMREARLSKGWWTGYKQAMRWP